ncbi:MAG: hypothetical protein RI957_71 [Verrucomicrobiota bacterium]|jgi:hypothetical protein
MDGTVAYRSINRPVGTRRFFADEPTVAPWALMNRPVGTKHVCIHHHSESLKALD